MNPKSFRAFPLPAFLTLLLVASPALAPAKTFVVPHILEKSGSTSVAPYTFDTTLFLTYNASLHGGDNQSAQMQFFLYDQNGSPMRGLKGEVCSPCNYTLDSEHRKLAIRIDDLIVEQGGGFDAAVKLGFAVVVVSGSGADAVNMQGFVVNSHESPQDLSVFGFDPQPLSAEPATRRTHVVPHVLETSGKTSTDTYSFDTTLYATYVGGLPGAGGGGGAEVQLYLYDQAGAPMQDTQGAAICNPCTFALSDGADGAGVRKQTIQVHDLLEAAGAFAGSKTRLGFGLISVAGQDPGNVALQGFIVNSHTSAFDLSVFGFEPQPIKAATARASARTFILPHVLERNGTTAATPYSFDTTIFATYTPGLGGLPDGAGATADLYLYDNNGTPMVGLKGTPVCAPCTFDVGPSARKQSIRLDDLIVAAGGFDSNVKVGFGVVVVGGEDPAGVNLQSFIVNSHTSPFDMSVFGFQPEEIRAPSAAQDNSPAVKTFVLPHVLEKQGTISGTQYTYDTTLYAAYSGGLPGGGAESSATLKLYLFDPATSLPLTTALGEVCNPCAFGLSATNRKATILMDDLIDAAGGFMGATIKTAMGLVVLEGDAANVGLQGFIVNAHTGAFDLSVFGFEPQPLLSARLAPMPIQMSSTSAIGRPALLVPTVIGAQYVVETAERIDGTWQAVNTFAGDGTVQTIPLSPAGAARQFYRVNGN